MSDFGTSSRYRVNNGFLTRPLTAAEEARWQEGSRTLDAARAAGGYYTRDGTFWRDGKPSSPRAEDQEADDPNMVSGQIDEIEIHNYVPGEPEYSTMSLTEREPDWQQGANPRAIDDEEEGEEPEDFVARYPANSHTVITEDFEGQPHHVVYRSAGEGRAPESKTDIYDMNDARARDSRHIRVKTLADLNRFNASFYGQARDSRGSRPPRSLAELNRLHHEHYAFKGPRR